MSIELDWSTVDYELTRSVHAFLSTAFAESALPDFVGPVSLDHFSFGSEHPDVQILDITDIDKTFLLAPDDLDDDNDDDDNDALAPPPPRSRSHSHSHSYSRNTSQHSDGAGVPIAPAHPLPPPPPASSAPSPSFQLLVRISYSGNLSLALSTSLKINYPAPGFMSLPLQLSLTDLAFKGVLVVAFEGGKNRVHISLVEAQDSDDATAAASSTDKPHLTTGAATTTTAAKRAANATRFLKSAHIESRVGNADKHVLRNVGKVEKFVLDVARTTLENELAFPNFQTIMF
ncbi:hypothetical protein BMF94_0444 [Rhodotorula taiwanensis]|uniref:Mitochondrial distribution and morphology protein 12 n=1 Tax=Rhodotorula taiwanensis TaxID=741276 RepID=A0A2S5BHJ2_9BASI|nr:hypothetical protein BMF94_0444 [Rhodotorula taiwanensis]